MRPLMSLPSARVSFDLVPINSGDSIVLAQPDNFAVAVRHLNPDCGLARHALDQNALGFERQAEVIREVGDAAVLDARLGLEFERRDHRAGIDLRHLPVNVELGILFRQHLGQQLQFVGINGLLLVRTMQQAAGRQLEAAGRDARHGRLGLGSGVGAFGDFNIRNDSFGGRARRLRLELVVLGAGRDGHAIDASGSDRLRRISGGGRTRGNQLSCDRRPGSTPLLQLFLHLLFRAVVLPVLIAVPERNREGETRWSPHSQGSERESRREIQRHRQNCGAHNVCAGRIQVMDQHVAHDASDQALHGNHAHPAHMSGHERQQRGHKDQQPDCAQRLGDRRSDLARAEPA